MSLKLLIIGYKFSPFSVLINEPCLSVKPYAYDNYLVVQINRQFGHTPESLKSNLPKSNYNIVLILNWKSLIFLNILTLRIRLSGSYRVLISSDRFSDGGFLQNKGASTQKWVHPDARKIKETWVLDMCRSQLKNCGFNELDSIVKQ